MLLLVIVVVGSRGRITLLANACSAIVIGNIIATIALVLSSLAGAYYHGSLDPIASLVVLAVRNRILTDDYYQLVSPSSVEQYGECGARSLRSGTASF